MGGAGAGFGGRSLSQVAYQDPPVYEASPWGASFHKLGVDEGLGAGSAGPGKSLVMLCDVVPFIRMEDDRCVRKELRWNESSCKMLFLRRQLNELPETIGRARRIYHRADENVKFREDGGKTVATFRSGMQVIFGGCKDPHDYVQYQGSEYTRIYYDELSEFEQEQYEQINTRNRSSDPVLQPFVCVRAATNPCANWVRKMFVDPAPKGRVVLRRKLLRPNGEVSFVTRMFLPATLYDNPNKEFVRQYELKLLSRPAHIRNALLFGDWYSIVGGYYADAWRKDLHVIRPFRIPGHWPRFRTMDWGFKTYGTCLWWAVNEDEDLICEKEFNFRLMEDYRVAARIREIEIEMGLWDKARGCSKLNGWADTNLWEQRGSAAESKAEVMAKAGIRWQPADKSDKSKNAQRFYKRLRDHGDGTTMPGIVFFDEARMCAKTIPGIGVDPNDSENPAKSDEDHWHDAVLIACAARAKPANDQGKDWYADDEDEDEEPQDRRRARGRLGYGSW